MNYLLVYRLQWGRPDVLSKLPSKLDPPDIGALRLKLLESVEKESTPNVTSSSASLPEIPPGTRGYFTADISPALVSIIQNDWPYSGLY